MLLGSEVLEVGIGIVLMFLLISLICSSVQEGLEGWLKWRAADLERGIRELLNDRDGTKILDAFYEHPLISSLYKGPYDSARRGNLPSYIPAGNFAGAVMDLVARGKTTPDPSTPAGPLSFDDLKKTINDIKDPKIQQALLTALDTAQGDINKFKANLETWFNSAMDRVSGWYKRRTQFILFALGLAAAVLLNIDTLTVAQHLVQDKALRDAVVSQAAKATGTGDNVDQLRAQLTQVGYPVGWNDWWPGPQKVQIQCTPQHALCIGSIYVPSALLVLIGWLITAFATMLGAPFWFDVLNKFMVIRSTVKPHEKSPEEGSEDRQNAATLRLQLAPPGGSKS